MLRIVTGLTKPNANREAAERRDTGEAAAHAGTRRSLWRLILFLLVSLAALPLREVDLFAVVPEGVAQVLGAPPPVCLIHLVLVVSTLCTVVLVTARGEGGTTWTQFLVLSFFYPLYATAGVLVQCYPLVLAAGVLVYLVEHAAAWSVALHHLGGGEKGV